MSNRQFKAQYLPNGNPIVDAACLRTQVAAALHFIAIHFIAIHFVEQVADIVVERAPHQRCRRTVAVKQVATRNGRGGAGGAGGGANGCCWLRHRWWWEVVLAEDQVVVAVDQVAVEQVVVAPQVVVVPQVLVAPRGWCGGGGGDSGSARRRVGRLGCGRFSKVNSLRGSTCKLRTTSNTLGGPTWKLRTHFTNATRRNRVQTHRFDLSIVAAHEVGAKLSTIRC